MSLSEESKRALKEAVAYEADNRYRYERCARPDSVTANGVPYSQVIERSKARQDAIERDLKASDE